jgi:ASC-1-like (ASCH) protein
VSEPWFSLIKIGAKKVEGRLNKGDFGAMKVGDIIVFENSELSYTRRFKVIITKIDKYNTFGEYLTSKKLNNCLPGIDTLEEGVSIYRKYYSASDEISYGILAITVKVEAKKLRK